MARSERIRRRSEKDSGSGCCSRRCFFLNLLIILAVGGAGFAVWWFFFDGKVTFNQVLGDVFAPLEPEARGPPTSSPNSAPRTFAPTITSSPTSSDDILDAFCPDDNTLGARRFLKTQRRTFYVIELVKFGNSLGKKRYEDYKTFMKDNIIRQAGGEVAFDFVKDGGSKFEAVFVVRYPSGNAFRRFVMEETTMAPMLDRRKSLLTEDSIYFTTLNEDVSNLYPALSYGPQFYSTPAFLESNPQFYNPEAFLIHAVKFLSTPVLDGREKVAVFDAETEDLKSANGIFAHGWLDIISTCRGKINKFDQIRIESIKTFEDMGEAMSTNDWVKAQRSREEGLEPVSFSSHAFYNDFSNLYYPENMSPVWSPAWSPAMSPAGEIEGDN